jgi:hypothetical protein
MAGPAVPVRVEGPPEGLGDLAANQHLVDGAKTPDPENVRTEYTALQSFSNAVVGFRFTTLGFYLAATGFIVGRNPARAEGLLLLGITIALWLMEVRNRSLIANLAGRGVQIERELWDYSGPRAFDAFYCRQYKRPARDGPEPPSPDPGFIWRQRLPFVVGHTLALDLLFTVIGAYSLYIAIRG